MVALTAQRCTSPSISRGQAGQGRGSVHGRNAPDDTLGQLCDQWRRARDCEPVAPFAGLAFEASTHANGKTLHSYRIIPDRGSWFETQFDTNDLLYVYLDRKKRRRKFLITTFFRALCFLKDDGAKGTDREILEMFYDIER